MGGLVKLVKLKFLVFVILLSVSPLVSGKSPKVSSSGMSYFVSSESQLGRQSKDSLEYISVASVILPVVLYSVALIIIPACVVLTVILFVKLEILKPGIEIGRFLPDGRFLSNNLESDCLHRISCEFLVFGLDLTFGKQQGNRSDRIESKCDQYKCLGLFTGNVKSSMQSRKDEQLFPEFNFLEILPHLQTFLEESMEHSSLTYFITNYGLWPPYISAILLLSFPIMIFSASIFLVILVVDPEESENERRRLVNLNKKRRRGKKLDVSTASTHGPPSCLLGIFCAIDKPQFN